MKRFWGLSAIAIVAGTMMIGGNMVTSSPASAETIKEVCEVALAKEGVKDFSGCACMQELVKGKPDLEKELIRLKDKGPGIAPRRAAANDAGKKALDTCFKAKK